MPLAVSLRAIQDSSSQIRDKTKKISMHIRFANFMSTHVIRILIPSLIANNVSKKSPLVGKILVSRLDSAREQKYVEVEKRARNGRELNFM